MARAASADGGPPCWDCTLQGPAAAGGATQLGVPAGSKKAFGTQWTLPDAPHPGRAAAAGCTRRVGTAASRPPGGCSPEIHGRAGYYDLSLHYMLKAPLGVSCHWLSQEDCMPQD